MKNNMIIIGLVSLLAASCNNNDASANTDTTITEPAIANAPQALAYTVVNIIPHDSTAFTQGFYFHNGKIFEGTGAPELSNYKSSLRILNPANGKVEKLLNQDTAFFGEGITILNNKLYQLTWRNHKIFVYDPVSFKKTGEFPWSNEGWGITSDGKSLLISDGSSNISVVNPETMQVERIVGVYDNNGPVGDINELEYIDGFLYANKWETDYILKIDLSNGKVVGKADFSGLLARNTKENLQQPKYAQFGGAVLNGIAYDSTKKSLYITGKLWPYMFEIKWQ